MTVLLQSQIDPRDTALDPRLLGESLARHNLARHVLVPPLAEPVHICHGARRQSDQPIAVDHRVRSGLALKHRLDVLGDDHALASPKARPMASHERRPLGEVDPFGAEPGSERLADVGDERRDLRLRPALLMQVVNRRSVHGSQHAFCPSTPPAGHVELL